MDRITMYLSRDKDGGLHLNYSEPMLVNNRRWECREMDFMELYTEDFPEVTFENSPQEVELVIKK